jgi:hypothetical protein
LGGTGSRNTTLRSSLIGANTTHWYYSDYKVYDFVAVSKVLQTADFTPNWGPYWDYIHSIDLPNVFCNESLLIRSLDGFVETATKTGSDEIKYVLYKGSTPYYWTGAAWAVSDLSSAQMNTAAVIHTNKATFTTSACSLKVKAFLISADGLTTPQLDNLQVDYTLGKTGGILGGDML